MSPRTEEQFKEIREQKRQIILDAALEIFAEEGYYSASIAKIAQKAGISKGLIYNYYKSKEELVKKIAFDGIEKLMVPFDPNHDGILTQEELIFMIDESFRILHDNIKNWRLYFAIILQPSVFEIIKQRLFELMLPVIEITTNYFAKKGYENPEVETRFLFAMLDGIFLNYIADTENFQLEAIKNKIIDMYK